MAAQRGKDVLLKVDDGTGTFSTVAGLRTRRLTLNAESVDITNSESVGRWRELLDGAGVKRANISGGGVFKDGASDLLVRQILFDGLIRTWQVIIPNFGVISGFYQITSLDYRGEHAGEVTFEMALESAGPLSFTAL